MSAALRRFPLAWHLAGLALLLLLLVPAVRWSANFTTDEGSYRLQVAQLEQGRWSFDYQTASIDPSGRWFPMVNGGASNGRYFPYVSHPAYPALLRASASALGDDTGTHLPQLIGLAPNFRIE